MAGPTGKEFNANVSKWAKQFKIDMDALARQSCMSVSYRVVRRTRVDTGFLKGSWQPSLTSPNPGPRKAGAAPGNGANQAMIAAVCAGMKAGDRFWMVNNAAYALRIEFGFVGEDSIGRVYNQQGDYNVTKAMKAWPQIVGRVAKSLVSAGGTGNFDAGGEPQ
jgi:hypothetical protein